MRSFYLSILFFSAMILISSDHAAARTYHRSCSAWYEIRVTSVGGAEPARHIKKTRKVGKFSGRGKCGPYTRINDCRRRARDFCHSCMKDHWRKRRKNSQPGSCTYYSNGVGVQDYDIVDLKDTLDAHVCAVDPDSFGDDLIRYDVYRVTNGDKGCGGKTRKTMREKLGSLRTRCQ